MKTNTTKSSNTPGSTRYLCISTVRACECLLSGLRHIFKIMDDIPLLKSFKKIPIYVVEEHNEALQFIYSAIGGKKLPLEGTTLLHLDAHPDMLIDRKLKGEDARSGRKLLPLLQIENWIVPAAAAGYISRVVWLHPPWAKQFSDGTRVIHVGDDPETGLLRVDSTEPYYLSDALYSPHLINERKFILTVDEFCGSKRPQQIASDINMSSPFVLDIDLDFFSTGNPFLSLYENIGLYERLKPIFDFAFPDDDKEETLKKFVKIREQQLQELENLFQHLEEYNNLDTYNGERTELFEMVSELATVILAEANRLGEHPDWWAAFAGGCTSDQGGLPCNRSTEEEIRNMIYNSLRPLLKYLPSPTLVTIARSTEDGYCPPDQVEFIQNIVLEVLNEVYDADKPQLHYLKVNTF